MTRIQNPILFSKHFGIDRQVFIDSGLIDPFLNVDTPLFIDPVLLSKSSNDLISGDGYNTFRDHFGKFIRLLTLSRSEGDVAWRAARKLLDLSEPDDNGLGYGGSGRVGASRPDGVREAIMATCKEIITLGSSDPDMIGLMGFFEAKVGPDTISDFTTQVIRPQLAEISRRFCEEHNIPLHQDETDTIPLPIYQAPSGKTNRILLVPKDIVKDLPVANDWSEIESAALANHEIRERVNRLLGRIAGSTVEERKEALKVIATESKESFEHFLQSVKEHADFYDPWIDSLAYYRVKSILSDGFPGLPQGKTYDLTIGPGELMKLVNDTLDAFQHHVEKGNLWEELWIEDKPKKERAAQLIYYAIADVFCRANNVDISPEAQMGGGPVDFKFSKGYNARVLVEMKRSSGTVVHGYEKQLEIYKEASRTNFGILVVMDYGGLGDKVTQIQEIRAARLKEGLAVSDILVIDAKKKASASKRK